MSRCRNENPSSSDENRWEQEADPTAREPGHFLAGRLFCGFGTRPRSGREGQVYGYVAFSPLSQRVPCVSVGLPLWETCGSAKFPSLSPEHFIYPGAKLETEQPLTQLMNDSIFSGRPPPAHCPTVMPSCVGVPCHPGCYATPVQGVLHKSQRDQSARAKSPQRNQDQSVFLEKALPAPSHVSSLPLACVPG